MSDTAYGRTFTFARDPRWRVATVLCASQLMIFLDATVVNVALQTIEQHLRFSQASLSWVVNAYLLTFGGFLLLGGRAGDLFGRRRRFVWGMALFVAASAACAVAGSPLALILARAAQGLGGAVISAVGLSMIVTLFSVPADRARVMGIFSFVASGGGTLGVLLGGVLTQATGWRSIFLINLPTGAVILGVARSLPSSKCNRRAGRRLDLLGAVTIACSLMLAILGCSRANSNGWTAGITLTLLSGALAIFMLFLLVESRAPAPLMPLGMFRSRELSSANALAVLLRAAMFSWFFLSPLYMQRILGFSVLETGLGFLPATLIIGAFSYSLTSRIVSKVGVRAPFVAGAVFVALGLAASRWRRPGATMPPTYSLGCCSSELAAGCCSCR